MPPNAETLCIIGSGPASGELLRGQAGADLTLSINTTLVKWVRANARRHRVYMVGLRATAGSGPSTWSTRARKRMGQWEAGDGSWLLRATACAEARARNPLNLCSLCVQFLTDQLGLAQSSTSPYVSTRYSWPDFGCSAIASRRRFDLHDRRA